MQSAIEPINPPTSNPYRQPTNFGVFAIRQLENAANKIAKYMQCSNVVHYWHYVLCINK